MLNPQDIVKQEFDKIQASSKWYNQEWFLGKAFSWLENLVTWIKHLISPKTEKLDDQRDWNEARLRAVKKLEADMVRSDVDLSIKQYKQEQAEIEKLEEETNKLSNLPEYSDMFVRTKKKLADKKQAFLDKQAMYYEKMGKYNEVSDSADIIKLSRGSLSASFVNKDNAEKFLTSVMAQPTEWKDNASLMKNRIEKTALQNLFDQYDPIVNNMVREWMITTPDEFYNSQEFIGMAKQAVSAISNPLSNNLPKLLDEKGELDWEKLLSEIKNNPQSAQAMKQFENKIRKDKQSVRDSKYGKAQDLWFFWREYANVVEWKSMIFDYLNQGYEMYNDKWKSFGFFWDKEIKNYVYWATDTDFNWADAWFDWDTARKVWRYIQTNVLANPVDTAWLLTDIATAFMSWRWLMYGKYLWQIDDAVDAIKFWAKTQTWWVLANIAKQAIKKVPRIGDEILMSLPLNSTIDAFMGEYDNFGMNTAMDAWVWVLAKVDPVGLTKKIKSELANFGDQALKEKAFKWYFWAVPENLDLADAKQVENFVDTQVNTWKNKWDTFTIAKDIIRQQVNEAPNSFWYEFFENYFKRVVPTTDELFWTDYNKYFADNITRATKVINDPAMDIVEKTEKLRDEFKRIMNVSITDKGLESLTNYKLAQFWSGNAFNSMTEVFVNKWWMNQDAAKSLAFEILPHLSANELQNGWVFSKLFSEFGDVNKSETIAKELNKTVTPFLLAKESPQLTMKEFDDMLSAKSMPENKEFKVIWNRSTLEKDWYTFVITKETVGEKWSKFVLETIDTNWEVIAKSDYKSMASAQKAVADMVQPKTVQDMWWYRQQLVEQMELDSWGKLWYAVWDFISRLPENSAEPIAEGFLEFYKALWKKWEKGIRGWLGKVFDAVLGNVYNADFYSAYKLFDTTDESITRIFGEEFMNYVNTKHKGVIDIDVLWKLHTQYLLENFLLSPDSLQSYITQILKNDALQDSEKALLIAQIKEMNTVVVEPIGTFIRGIMDYKGMSEKEIEKVLSIVQIEKTKEIISGIPATPVVWKPIVDVQWVDMLFEQDIATTLSNFKSEYVQALATGVSAKGSPNYIPPLRDVAYGIKNAIDNWWTYDIPASYLSNTWLRVLDDLFYSQTKKYKWYQEFIDNAFKKKQWQFFAIGDSLIRNFYDETTGTLKVMADVDWQSVSVFDLLNTIDSALSENIIGNSWGIVVSPLLSMTKYQLLTDKAGFVDTWKKFIGWYINEKYTGNAIKEKDVEKFLARTGTTDAAEWYMKIVKDVEDEFITIMVREWLEYTDEMIQDFLHPLYYSFDEYFIWIAKGEQVDIVKSVLNVLWERQAKNWTIWMDYAKHLVDEDMSKWFVKFTQWQKLKNFMVSEIAESWGRYVRMNSQDIKLNMDTFNKFVYKNLWYFLLKTTAWFYDNDALSIFGSKLVHLAKQSLEPKQVVELNKLIDWLYTARKAQNKDDVVRLKDKITKILKRTNVPEFLMKEYFGVLDDLDNKWAIAAMIPSGISNYIKKFASEVEIPTSPAEVIDEAIKLWEERAEFRFHFLQTQQARREEIVRQSVIEQITKWAEQVWETKKWLPKYDDAPDRALDSLLDALGMSKKNARDALINNWFSDASITDMLRDIKKPLNDVQALKAITDLVRTNQVWAWYILKNQVFQRLFNGIQKRILDSKTSTELRAINPKTGKPDWRMIVDIITKDWAIDKKINESFGWMIDTLLKSITSLWVRWLYDEERKKVNENYLQRFNEWNIFKPKILIDGKERPVSSIQAYLRAVRNNLTEMNVRNNYSIDEITKAAEKAWWQEKFFWIYWEQQRLHELYEFFKNYKDDISFYRWKFNELGINGRERVPDISMLTKVANVNEMVNRMTGVWVNMSNLEVTRLAQRFGIEQSANPKRYQLLSQVNKNFKKDVLYWWLYDENAWRTWSNVMTQLYILFNYNWVTRPFAWVQQLWNNKKYADSLYRATWLPSNKDLDKLASEKFAKEVLWFDLISGKSADVTLGSRINGARYNFSQQISSLYQADKLSLNNATRSSLAQAFAPLYDAGGTDAVNLMIKKMRNREDFLGKYDMDFKLFDSKYRSIEHLKLKAVELWEDPTQVLLEYHKQRTMYHNEFAPIHSKARSALSAFYATDNIREFASIRLTDASAVNKYVFALKKWSLAKAWEYVYRLAQETDGTMTGLLRNVVNGKSPAIREMAIQIAEYTKAWWMFERASGGDYEAEDLMYQMSIPTVVFSMALFDAMNKWLKSWVDMAEATDSAWKWTLDGVIETINSFMGTAFIYHKWFFESLGRGMVTASQYEWTEDISPFAKWVEAFLNHAIIWALTKWQVDRYRGIEMRSGLGGNDVSRTFAWLTNTTSSAKAEQDRLIDNLYKADAVSRWYWVKEALMQGVRDNSLLSFLGKIIWLEYMKPSMQFVDLWIVGNDVKEWLYSKNMNLLFQKHITDKEAFGKMVDNITDVRTIDRIAQKMWWTDWDNFVERRQQGNVSQDEYMKLVKENGIVPELPIWTYIEQQLAFSSWVGKEIRDMQYEQLIDTEVTDKLANDFVQFVTERKINITNDQGAILKFINAKTQLGSNYAMSEYMKAYSNWVWKIIQNNYKLKDVKFWFEEGIDRIQAYTDVWEISPQFVTAVADYQNILKDSLFTIRPDVVWENPYIGLDIQNKYVALAPDLPVKDRRSGFSEFVFIETTANLLERDWAVSDEVMNVFNTHASRIIKRIWANKEWGSEDKQNAVAHLLRTANRTLDVLEERDMSWVAKASMRMWLAHAYTPMVDYISEANEWEFNSLMKRVWPELQMFVDSITGSSPLDTKTALEYATNKDLSWWGSGKWKKWANAKPQKKRHDKELQLATTKIKNLAGKIPWYKYAGTNWNAVPWYKPTKNSPPSREFEIDFWDLSIKVWTLGWPVWWPEWWTGKTQRIKLAKRSSSNIPSKKRTPLKIKSFKI